LGICHFSPYSLKSTRSSTVATASVDFIEFCLIEKMQVTNSEVVVEISHQTAEKSETFIGQWNRLISTTNWEKGSIIYQWRETLKKSKVNVSQYSDEAWSQLVGGVTPQHVGRLRRTAERFGHVYQEYEGIYWSHFYAALEWDDAEMWLEGAVQNQWSVSAMRRQRWEVLGRVPELEPVDSDIVSSEVKEENQSLELSEGKRKNDRDYIEGPVYEGPDFGEQDPMRSTDDHESRSDSRNSQSINDQYEDVEPVSKPNVRPFESFVDLPEDVEEATNAFKVAIIRHRAAEWEEISQSDMFALLDALKLLVSSG
jgi:hypothetical protein